MQEFNEKVAVITGAASGLGRGLARRCAAEGMRIAVADVEEKGLASLAKDLEAEMLVVAHHSRNWWEKALVGSVAQYLIDRSDVNVVVLH